MTSWTYADVWDGRTCCVTRGECTKQDEELRKLRRRGERLFSSVARRPQTEWQEVTARNGDDDAAVDEGRR